MADLTTIILLTSLAGLAMPIVAGFSRIERIRPAWLEDELRHGLIVMPRAINQLKTRDK